MCSLTSKCHNVNPYGIPQESDLLCLVPWCIIIVSVYSPCNQTPSSHGCQCSIVYVIHVLYSVVTVDGGIHLYLLTVVVHAQCC